MFQASRDGPKFTSCVQSFKRIPWLQAAAARRKTPPNRIPMIGPSFSKKACKKKKKKTSPKEWSIK